MKVDLYNNDLYKIKTRSLWVAFEDEFPNYQENFPNYQWDMIEDLVINYLRAGYSPEQCCYAAKRFLEYKPEFSDDLPYCFYQGMKKYLEDHPH